MITIMRGEFSGIRSAHVASYIERLMKTHAALGIHLPADGLTGRR